jgi:hypothetical protein
MNMVSACQVIKEATDSPPPLSNLNYAKLQSRAMTALNEKHRAVMSVGIGVTPNGQRLFNTIAKVNFMMRRTMLKNITKYALKAANRQPPAGLSAPRRVYQYDPLAAL